MPLLSPSAQAQSTINPCESESLFHVLNVGKLRRAWLWQHGQPRFAGGRWAGDQPEASPQELLGMVIWASASLSGRWVSPRSAREKIEDGGWWHL